MRVFHGRWRRQLSLLASGALEGREREETLHHLELCSRCREDRRAIEATLALLAADPAREAEPPVSARALLARVEARLDAAEPTREPGLRWRWALAFLAAAALAVALVPRMVSRTGPPRVEVSQEALRRIEGNVAREQAARYLSEAQDVLVLVAAQPRRCDHETQREDVAAASRQSRELLARRALLLEPDRAEVASARPVLDDVEQMLREVASLESCARVRDLQRVREEMIRRRLLMKIRLMARELEG